MEKLSATLLILLMFYLAGQAQESLTTPLFNSEALMELTLVTDFGKLLEAEEEEEAFDFEEEDEIGEETTLPIKKDRYHDGTLIFEHAGGKRHSIPIRLRSRGQFRLVYCDFPPLKIHFPPDVTARTPFENQYKLKLVTHCERDAAKYNEAVIHEYLLYKCYKVLSDISLDVRLVRLNYQKDTSSETKVSSYAFFIQSIDELAKNNKAIEIEDPAYFANPPDMVPDHKLAFFQYMIGNNDWAIPGHNCKMLRFEETQDTVAVPYDFDLAYLSRAHNFPLPKKEYKGGCPTGDELNTTVLFFNEKKEDLLNVYRECAWLSQDKIEDNITYIEQFYATINDQGRLQQEILKDCPN